MFRRKNEVSLESRLAQAMFDQSPDGMLLIQNGVFSACNKAAEVIYDHPVSQIIGRTPVEFSAPTQGDGRPSAIHVQERLGYAIANGMSRFEWLNVNSRGELNRILVTLIPTRIESDGELLVLIQSLAETAEVIDQLRGGLDALARGDLSCQIKRPFRTDYESLRSSFNSAVDSFALSMGKVLQTAQLVSSGSDEIQSAAHDLSSRTEQQAMKVEATVSTLNEVGQAMARSAGAAKEANMLVADTRARAEESGAVVARTVEAMAAIETSSREISDIISVIDGIAFQTNLLALNAGVEAARAGDAGRGFAVVASEVRALAQRSADAAKDIKSRIQGSAEHVANGVSLVTQTGTALSRIAEGVSEVSSVINQIAEDTNVQAERLRHVNHVVGEMDQITQSNAAMSEEASAAARSLAGQSSELMQELARFRSGGNGGMATYQTLRAA